MKSKLFLIVAVVLAIMMGLTFAMAGCKTTTTTAAEGTTATAATAATTAAVITTSTAKELTIGWSYYDMKYDYFKLMMAGAEDYCTANGIKYIAHDQASDEAQMVSGSENLINQGINALCICPVKPEALGSILKAARSAKIPIIVSDNGTGGFDVDAFLISDNYKGGTAAAQYLLKYLKEKGLAAPVEIAVMTQEISNVAAQSRLKGFVEWVNSDAEAKSYFKIISNVSIEFASADKTYPVAKDIITKNPNIAAIYCTNDQMAAGASQAAIDSGKTNFPVIGFDGQQSGLEGIDNGTILATVMQYPYQFGQLASEIAVKLIRGEPVEFTDPATKTINLPVKVLDKTNVQDGWTEVNRLKK
jgi:ribose transport system substrate-binding protein